MVCCCYSNNKWIKLGGSEQQQYKDGKCLFLDDNYVGYCIETSFGIIIEKSVSVIDCGWTREFWWNIENLIRPKIHFIEQRTGCCD